MRRNVGSRAGRAPAALAGALVLAGCEVEEGPLELKLAHSLGGLITVPQHRPPATPRSLPGAYPRSRAAARSVRLRVTGGGS